ncbi:hypothetical protein NQZ68_040703 [Dissostichus eleginoides]|nr:hypothetical protein NQZ68_040703 [Dissostichus eleginoides]
MRGALRGAPAALVTLDNLEPIAGPRGGDVSFECLPYQLSMVLSVPTMVTTVKKLVVDLGIELTVRRKASYRLSQPLPLGASSMLLTECPAGDGRGIRIVPLEGNSWTGARRTKAKAFAKNVFINQERKSEVRRRSDTVVVPTINDAKLAIRRRYSHDPPGSVRETKVFGFRGEYGWQS